MGRCLRLALVACTASYPVREKRQRARAAAVPLLPAARAAAAHHNRVLGARVPSVRIQHRDEFGSGGLRVDFGGAAFNRSVLVRVVCHAGHEHGRAGSFESAAGDAPMYSVGVLYRAGDGSYDRVATKNCSLRFGGIAACRHLLLFATAHRRSEHHPNF